MWSRFQCSFFKYGPSGTVQTLDAICVLPVNIMNEKVYVFLWFWFLILTAISVVGLVYHVFFALTPAFTKMYLRTRSMNQKDLHLDDIGRRCEMGDWKLLYLLAKNMEPLVFGEFLRELHRAFRKADANDSATAGRGGGAAGDLSSGSSTASSTRKALLPARRKSIIPA